MTLDDFRLWLADFRFRFPTTDAWVRADHGADQLQQMIRSWFEVFATLPLEAAMEATKGIQAGELEHWGRNSDLIPATIRRHALSIAYKQRANSDDPELPPPPPRGANGLRFAEMFRYVSQALKDNVPKAIWLPEGLKRLGDVPTDRQPRYRCRTCMDTGYVIVWNRQAIGAFRNGTLPQFKSRRTMATRCACRPRHRDEKSIVYDERQHCRTHDDGRTGRDIDTLEKFLAESAMAGDFVEYNRQGGHL
jgi:hypothetical protein